MCNKRGLTPLDVCQPQVRQSIYGKDFKYKIFKHIILVEIALSNGQNPQQKIQYTGETWRKTKTLRSRDATWSRWELANVLIYSF